MQMGCTSLQTHFSCRREPFAPMFLPHDWLPDGQRPRLVVVSDCSVLGDEIEPVLDRRRVYQPIGGIAGKGGREADGGVRDRRAYANRAHLRRRPSSQERTGIVTAMRSCLASHANSYQEMAATTSSSAFSRALRAGALTRFGSADHQCTTWVSRRTAPTPTRRSRTLRSRTPAPRRQLSSRRPRMILSTNVRQRRERDGPRGDRDG